MPAFSDMMSLGSVVAYRGAAPVTPSDNDDLPKVPTRALLSDVDGSIKVTFVDGSVATLPVLGGVPINVQVSRVWSTGTTSGLTILALY